jgi:hypothetical protein
VTVFCIDRGACTKEDSMQGFRRTIVTLGTIAVMAAMTGCTGLGVNFGSGAKGGTNITNVGIQTITGINLLQLNAGHCLVVQAVATTSGTPNGVSSVQGAVWTKINGTENITLLEADCSHLYAGESQQAIGITNTVILTGAARKTLVLPASGTATIMATVQGVTGTNTVTVFNF